MSKLQETEQQHLQEQARLAIQLCSLNNDVKACEERLKSVNTIINTFKFVSENTEPELPDTPLPEVKE